MGFYYKNQPSKIGRNIFEIRASSDSNRSDNIVDMKNATHDSLQQPIELGKVHWIRSYEKARALARASNKPLLILFQEVPGCATCSRYGNVVLSHPLIVEAIETYFTPLCIYNNKGGDDATTLQFFHEPAWNNPVIRIVDPISQKDKIERLNDDYSPQGLMKNIIDVLKSDKKNVPEWVALTKAYFDTDTHTTISETYAMYCFWSGEVNIGKIDGIVSTQTGFSDNKEVVKVTYANDIIKSDALERLLNQSEYTKLSKDAQFNYKKKDAKYYLSHSNWKYIPMLPNQASKANSYYYEQNSIPTGLLSPRQVDFKDKLDHLSELQDLQKSFQVLIDGDEASFIKQWNLLQKL